MKKFNKRTYKSFTDFFKDIKFIFNNRAKLKELNSGEIIKEDFKERLMMAVTAVNGCRYCSYYHTRLALEAGISLEELDKLIDGSVKNSPEKERIALLYAQHWAEQAGQPDQDFTKKLIEHYGAQKADYIQLAIRTINFGNLTGNTFDYLLYKMSFGHLGLS